MKALPTHRNRVRHPQLGHLVENVASSEDFVSLCRFVSSGQSITEAHLVWVEHILCPGLMVLASLQPPASSLQTPTTMPNLADALEVRISFAQEWFTPDDRISPGCPPARVAE